MPWNDQSNGSGPRGPNQGQRPGDNDKSPWGNGPSGGGGGGEPPDVDEIVRDLQRRVSGIFGGGGGGNGSGKSRRAGGLGIGVIITFVLTAWLLTTGWYIAQPDEQGVIIRFGAYQRTEGPGFHLKLPAPVERVMKPKVTRIHREEIGFRSNGRIGDQASSRDVAQESQMLTGDENIVELDFIVFWRINDARAYLFNVRNVEETLKAVAESAMREIVGKNELNPIMTDGRTIVEETTLQLAQQALDEYESGVLITQIQLTQADPPARVVEAFRDVVNAGQDAETLVNNATGYRNRVVPEARGAAAKVTQNAEAYREATVAEASGEAARFTLVYNEYKRAPQVTRQRMYLETMESVLQKSNIILMDDDAGSGVVPYLPLNEFSRASKGDQQ